MTGERYATVSVGQPIQKVVKRFGQPYQIEKLADGSYHYVYIQRVRLPTGELRSRHYIFVVKDGCIQDKYFYEEGQRSIDIDLDDTNLGN